MSKQALEIDEATGYSTINQVGWDGPDSEGYGKYVLSATWVQTRGGTSRGLVSERNNKSYVVDRLDFRNLPRWPGDGIEQNYESFVAHHNEFPNPVSFRIQ